MGRYTLAVDKSYGHGGDLLDDEVFQKLCWTVSLGAVSWLHLGLPCETWSRARKHDGQGPPPMRDDHHGLWGVKNELLGVADRRKLADANRLARLAMELIRVAARRGKVVTVENPASSRLWKTPEVQALIRDFNGSFAHADCCQYGTAWKKPTSFLVLGLAEEVGDLRRCGAGHLCTRTGLPHVPLTGKTKDDMFKTRAAQAYPSGLAFDIAAVILSSSKFASRCPSGGPR